MSGLGERGKRLRRSAALLDPAPAVPPFYVQVPDFETRAMGWYMRWTRDGEPVYLGHAAASAEVYLLRLGEEQGRERKPGQRVQKKVGARSTT